MYFELAGPYCCVRVTAALTLIVIRAYATAKLACLREELSCTSQSLWLE